MSEVFISFKDKKKIYNPKKLVNRLFIKKRMKSIRKDTYTRFADILYPKQIRFSDYDVESVATILDSEIHRILGMIKEINKDRDPIYKRSLIATDVQCAVNLHGFLSS